MGGSFLDWLVGLLVPAQEIFFLLWMLCSVQKKIFLSFRTLQYFSHRPATWAGSRAWPPVSECVSPAISKSYINQHPIK